MHEHLDSIADLLRLRTSSRPEMVATVCEDRQTTLAFLDRRANQVAHGLIEVVGASQNRAAVLDTNSDTFFELLSGAAKAGCVLVPLNNRLAASELAEVIDDAAVELLFVGAECSELAEAVQRSCQGLRTIITLGEAGDVWDDYA